MKAPEVYQALRKLHDQPRNGNSRAWVYAEEVRVGTGWKWNSDEWADSELRLAAEQRIDAFAAHTWPSHKFKRVAYEVKVSAGDLNRELADPLKSQAALMLSNQFYLVVPHTLKLTPADVPEEWGILSVGRTGRLRAVQRAPWRDTPLPPYQFMLSLARNLCCYAEKVSS